MMDSLYKLINDAVAEYADAGLSIPQFSVTVPANENYGDFSTGVAFNLASLIKKPPYEIAVEIAKKMENRRHC
jgi:arginyl-tRNA synthetase